MNNREHHARVRYRARAISWVLAPCLSLAFIAWFAWNMIVCPASAASPLLLEICAVSQLLPDTIGFLVLVTFVLLIVALAEYSADSRGIKKSRSLRSRAMTLKSDSVHGYNELEEEHKDIVFRALEAAGWSLAITIGVLIYYHTNVSQPLAIVVIALLLRVVIGMLKGMWGLLVGVGDFIRGLLGKLARHNQKKRNPPRPAPTA